MQIPCFHVDAFADRPFAGNPAAVCVLASELPADLMQAIAAENNLSETAFVVLRDGACGLRWFTPTVEMDLCGHATLAAAHVLKHHFGHTAAVQRFATVSGELRVTGEDGRLVLDFPSRPASPCDPPPGLLAGLGLDADTQPVWVGRSRDYLVVLDSSRAVEGLRPDIGLLAAIDSLSLIVTGPGEADIDFVSRFFAPGAGVPEDPVTGSAHCTLVPYWAQRLGRPVLRARQVSARGGDLFCEDRGERVLIGGNAITFKQGTLFIDASDPARKNS